MGKIDEFSFITPGQRKVYRPGDIVKGSVSFEVRSEDITVRGVHIYLCGATLTKWSQGKTQVQSKEIYCNIYDTLFGNDPGDGGNHKLTQGEHTYDYSFRLPSDGLPSSFQGSYGATRYWLRAVIVQPFPRINKTFYKSLTVLANVPVRTVGNLRSISEKSEKTISKALGFGDAGRVSLTVALDRSAYCPGESMLIDLTASNQSSKDMGSVKASLVQHVYFKANDSAQSTEYPIRTIVSDKIQAGKIVFWTKKPFKVDAMPPSSKPLTCHIIKVRYDLEVKVEVPFGFDLEVSLPVTIATLPFHSEATGVVSGGKKANDLGYVECTDGVRSFRDSDGMFENFPFTPYTAYVNNYTAQVGTNQSLVKKTTPSGGKTGAVGITGTAVAAGGAASGGTAAGAASNAQTIKGKNMQATGNSGPSAAEKGQNGASSAAIGQNIGARASGSAVKATSTDETLLKRLNSHQNSQSSHSAAPPTTSVNRTVPTANENSSGRVNVAVPQDEPPTYEEATGTTSSPAAAPVKRSGKGAILLVGFPEKTAEKVKSFFLSSDSKNIASHGGQILCVCVRPFSRAEGLLPWPMKTAVVMLYFPSQRKAEAWWETAKTNSPEITQDLIVMVAEDMSGQKPSPDPRNTMNAVIIQRRVLKMDDTLKALYTEYQKKILPTIKGRLVVTRVISQTLKFLQGDWSSLENKDLSAKYTRRAEEESAAIYKEESPVKAEAAFSSSSSPAVPSSATHASSSPPSSPSSPSLPASPLPKSSEETCPKKEQASSETTLEEKDEISVEEKDESCVEERDENSEKKKDESNVKEKAEDTAEAKAADYLDEPVFRLVYSQYRDVNDYFSDLSEIVGDAELMAWNEKLKKYYALMFSLACPTKGF